MSITLSPSSHALLHSHTRASRVYPLTRPSPFRLRTHKLVTLSCAAAANAPTSPSTAPTPAPSLGTKPPKDTTVLVVGSTGYIGKFVVRELSARGFKVIAVARPRSGIRGQNDQSQTLGLLSSPNSTVVFSDVTDLQSLTMSLSDLDLPSPIDAVVCCLASRNGGIKDSWAIDYSATKNSLLAGRQFGATHFVLLSAICVQKPLLEFQRAKLKFESELVAEAEKDPNFTYSIVRPTAFFKSLAGQVKLVKDGKPYVMFGDGKLCACKPISEEDLAKFIADCVLDEDKANEILPVGGPGRSLMPVEQGEMLFRLLGKEPKFFKVPIGVMDFAIGVLDALAKVFPGLEDAAVLAIALTRSLVGGCPLSGRPAFPPCARPGLSPPAQARGHMRVIHSYRQREATPSSDRLFLVRPPSGHSPWLRETTPPAIRSGRLSFSIGDLGLRPCVRLSDSLCRFEVQPLAQSGVAGRAVLCELSV